MENWTDKISVFNGDCMELMSRYPDGWFDLAIVDPPYGLKISNSDYLGNDQNDKKWNNRANSKKHTPKNWDNAIPELEYFKEIQRVSKNQIIWGWNYFVKYFDECPSYIIWNKEASGNYSDCEMAWCSISGNNKIFKWLWNGFRKQQPEERIHPTQKPVALYNWLLDRYAKPDFKILDTHLGSGSHAIACHYFGCEFTASELDSEYYEASKKRFELVTSQQKMF